MPRIIINDDLDSFSDAAVKAIHAVIQQATNLGNNVSIGLSGGSMPTQISPGLLALKDVDWRRVHFFFCDERVVPFNSPESTYGVYKALLFDRLPDLPVENVHKISVEGTAAEAAAKYQSDIMIFFGTDQGYPAFDLLLLGLGPDGHTCSLFPNHELLSVSLHPAACLPLSY
uniref:6-phosphogluconolactonase n=1 Tax=Schistocephalus solidus TaxID=70667 RepID=A0A0X3Q924_SCHSO